MMSIKTGLALIACLLALLIHGAPQSGSRAHAFDLPQDTTAPSVAGPLDFTGCVRVALRQSPFAVRSSLDIDLKRIDESDSRFGLFPSLSLRTRYYLNPPSDAGGDSPFAVDFVTDSYNPFEAYFSLQARKVLTQMAVLAHLQAISELIERLGMGFLELDALGRMAALQKELVGLCEQTVAYAKARVNTGGASLLDVRVAEQEAELARMELESMGSSESTIRDGLRSLMGLKEDQRPDLDLRDVKSQVLGHFDPATVTFDEVKNNSLEMKILSLRRELQVKNITLSYARFLPSFFMGVQTADPISTRDHSGYFFSVGLELPLWDGLKRYHNVSRQKTILRQDDAETEAKGVDLADKWRNAQDKLKDAVGGLKLSNAQEELAGIKIEQSEIGYKAGRVLLSDLLAERRKQVESRKKVAGKALEYAKAVLAVRMLSGSLRTSFVDAGSF